jgi:hypothetical protein
MATLKWVTLVAVVMVVTAMSGLADKVAPGWASFFRGFWVGVRPW